MTTPTITITDGTFNIPLIYNAANQYAMKATYNARIQPGESVATWHNSDDEAPQLMTLKDGNRAGFFELVIDNKAGTYKDDDVLEALTVLKRWVDGEDQQAARAEIMDDSLPIYLKVQRKDSSVATFHRVVYGFVDDAEAHYDAPSVLNNVAYRVVVYLTLSPRGQALNAISLDNYLKQPNFEIESSTVGQAAGWTKNGSPTLTLDTTIVLAGEHSQKVVATALNEGVYSPTVTNASDTQVCGYAWLYVASGTALVTLYNVDAGSAVQTVTVDTTDSGGNSDRSHKTRSGQTWYRIPVSGTVTSGHDVRLNIYSSGGAATFYANLAYVELGTLTVPDAWASYRVIYGKHDATNTTPDNINTFDIWGVPGDASGILTMGVTPDAARVVNISAWRDSRITADRMDHWFETITVGAAFGTPTTPTDAGRSQGAYYRVTTSVDDALTYDVTATSAATAREWHRLPRNIWVIARSSDASAVTFKSPDSTQTAQLSNDNTWEILRVWSAGGTEVNEDSTATTLSLVIASVVTSISMTIDVDAIIVQYVDQNIITPSISTGRHIFDGKKRKMYLASAAQPLVSLGRLWHVYPGPIMNRFMFLSWQLGWAHTLTETFTIDADVLPQTRHLLGVI